LLDIYLDHSWKRILCQQADLYTTNWYDYSNCIFSLWSYETLWTKIRIYRRREAIQVDRVRSIFYKQSIQAWPSRTSIQPQSDRRVLSQKLRGSISCTVDQDATKWQ
jgi:hypothetical protein